MSSRETCRSSSRWLDAASVCIVFGLMQVLTGLVYGMPMPVQPLKAMAAIMLTQKLSAGTLASGDALSKLRLRICEGRFRSGWQGREGGAGRVCKVGPPNHD
ncbi:MAG: putative sulfate/molybdate transporter [Myxococcales bacterium]|nr:putative sulfate/molybdate transporter [Myxococcales bacterium]